MWPGLYFILIGWEVWIFAMYLWVKEPNDERNRKWFDMGCVVWVVLALALQSVVCLYAGGSGVAAVCGIVTLSIFVAFVTCFTDYNFQNKGKRGLRRWWDMD